MKILGALLTLVLSSIAFAGSGGYTTETCVSGSGRTVLTAVYIDDGQAQVNLIIDGMAKKYENDEVVTGNDILSVQKDVQQQLVLAPASSGRNNLNLTVFKSADPRIGSALDQKAATQDLNVSLICNSFTQEP
jgi:hypothetical protein